MNLSKIKWLGISLILLSSCSDKDDNKIDNPDGPQGSGSMQEMTPEESKEYLQNTATEFLNLFNPQDQKQVFELAAYYSSEFGDLEAPEEFELDPDGYNRTPAPYLKALGQAAKGDLDGLTRAAYTYTFTVNFDKFTGVYEPNTREELWVKTGNSKDIVFKFSNKSGQPVELKVSQSGGTYDFDFSVIDGDEEWGNGNRDEYEVEYKYYLSIPKNVTVTLIENGKELANSTVISSINIDGHKMSAEVNATLMNLKAIAKVDGNDSKVAANTEFFVSGEKVATSYATINGNNICNNKKYQSMEDMDDEELYAELAKMFKSGDCGGDVLGKVQVYGQIEYYKALPEDLDEYWDNYDYDSKAQAQAACQKVCDRLNKNVKAQLRYNNTVTNQATIQFTPYMYQWGGDSEWEYYVTANLLFPDKTTYNIESYFDRFTNVANKWNSLWSAYNKLWKSTCGI
ncbi:MAG: hypothetical protein K2K25_12830 [Muribaculaceae bacterium]|nr:hypothetical protein [Muribaculaceae bacterium]